MKMINLGDWPPCNQLIVSFEHVKSEHDTKDSKYVCIVPLRFFGGYDLDKIEEFYSSGIEKIISRKILEDCKANNCIIAIDDSTETVVDETHIAKCEQFRIKNGIREENLIFLSGNANPSNKRIISTQVFETDWVQLSFKNVEPASLRFDKPFHYLCYNRHWNGHREYIVDSLLHAGLLPFGAVSLSDDSEAMPHSQISPTLKSMLPLVLDEPVGFKHPNLASNINVDHFNSSYLSLVNETFMFDSTRNDMYIFPTEKIFKAIIMRHPFIVNAAAGFLSHLRSIGYKTFSPIIDESYDDERDFKKRIQMTTAALKSLVLKLQGQKRIHIITELNEIAEYNRQVLLSKRSNNHPLLKYAQEKLNVN